MKVNKKLTKEQIYSIPEKLKTMTRSAIAKEWKIHLRTVDYWIKKLRAKGIEVKTKSKSII